MGEATLTPKIHTFTSKHPPNFRHAKKRKTKQPKKSGSNALENPPKLEDLERGAAGQDLEQGRHGLLVVVQVPTRSVGVNQKKKEEARNSAYATCSCFRVPACSRSKRSSSEVGPPISQRSVRDASS